MECVLFNPLHLERLEECITLFTWGREGIINPVHGGEEKCLSLHTWRIRRMYNPVHLAVFWLFLSLHRKKYFLCVHLIISLCSFSPRKICVIGVALIDAFSSIAAHLGRVTHFSLSQKELDYTFFLSPR